MRNAPSERGVRKDGTTLRLLRPLGANRKQDVAVSYGDGGR
jgi:hypothetical protein